MYVKVALIPPNKDYIVLRDKVGNVNKFPRQYARHVRAEDVCLMTEYRGRPQLKLLTDNDEVVILDAKLAIGPEPKPPEPIPTP